MPYACTPSPDFYDVQTFGVGQGAEEFLPLNPQSVSLPFVHSPSRLDYGQLRSEPAITSLDWLFTPSRKLHEHLLVATLQASTKYYLRFTLPTARSTGFGSCPSDLWHFHTIPLVNCGYFGFPADALQNSLSLPLKHTPWHVIQNARHNP